MADLIANGAIAIHMIWSRLFLRRPLLKAARDAQATQRDLLANILRENADTEFGLEHDFASVSGIGDYRKKVPVQSYGMLEPYVLRQQDGVRALTAAPPAYYARTSGTTGRSKDIPLTRDGLRQVKIAQRQLAFTLWSGTDFFKGSILGFASPVEEGRLGNGRAYGSASGSSYRSLSPLLERKFLLPHGAFSVPDVEAKYQIYALATLAADDVTGIAAANPSSILKLSSIIRQEAPLLIEALSTGSSAGLRPETTSFLAELGHRAKPNRLRSLKKAIDVSGALAPEDIWPRLSAIATWTGGSCGVALGKLAFRLPRAVKIVEYGYGSSEFMGAVNIDADSNICLPLLDQHYYEFSPRAEWEAGNARFLGLHELQAGEDYYIFVTTQSGLYRYNINDIIRAVPRNDGCCGISFVQKGRGVTNITGEKLSEDQLLASVTQALADNGLIADSFICLADEETSRYLLYLECPDAADKLAVAASVDQALRARNSEYDDKRASNRLKSLKLVPLARGAGETVKAWRVTQGVREAQYKPTLLDYARNWSDKLAPLVAGEHS